MAKFNKLSGAFVAVALTATLLPATGVSAAQAGALPGTVKNVTGTDQIIVKFKGGKSDLSAVLDEANGYTVKKTLSSGEKVLKVSAGKKVEDVLAKLQADSHVEFAELDHIHSINDNPSDPGYGYQYYLPLIKADYAWDYYRGSSAVKIAILDTGVDLDHPELSSKIYYGYDFVNGDSIADDDHGHGTHCAMIVGAHSNNGIGGVGIDWHARIMPVKVLNSAGVGYTSDIISGVYFAADNGAKVLLMPLGAPDAGSKAFQVAINYAYNTKGAVVIAPAGNNASYYPQYPANYDNVLSVAATTSTDTKASFSNYGPWVDIAAPGQSIFSGTTYRSGTSMSASVVAGVAGLVWARYGTSATPATVVSKILSTADAIPGTGTYWMNGRVNAYRAVTE